MKKFLLSTFIVLASLGSLAAAANAEQVNPGHSAADANGDGEVTVTEVKNYNRDQRES